MAERIRVTVRLVDGASGARLPAGKFRAAGGRTCSPFRTPVQEVAAPHPPAAGPGVPDPGTARRHQESRCVGIGAASPAGAETGGSTWWRQKDTTAAVAQRFSEADQLYTQARSLDTAWVEPVLGRGMGCLRRSRLVGLDPIAAKPWIDKGMQYAEQALALAPENADAYQLRGELRYWSWLLDVEQDQTRADKLLKDAQRISRPLSSCIRTRREPGPASVTSTTRPPARPRPSWRPARLQRPTPTSPTPT